MQNSRMIAGLGERFVKMGLFSYEFGKTKRKYAMVLNMSVLLGMRKVRKILETMVIKKDSVMLS